MIEKEIPLLEINMNRRKLTFNTAFLILVLLISIGPAQAEDKYYEEIVVSFEVAKLLQQDIIAVYDGRDVYVPLIEIFQLLDINVIQDFDNRKFHGQYITRDNKFEINIPKMRGSCFGESHHFSGDEFHITGNELYLKVAVFNTIFQMKMYFNFSELKVYLPLDTNFPAYQKLKRKAAHEKLKTEKAAIRDIAEIPFERKSVKAGVVDWVATVNPFDSRGQYLGLIMGGILLGGDVSVSGSVNSMTGFASDQVRYKWHYVFMDNKYLSQVELGDIVTAGGLSRSMKGVLLTNKPNTRRKFFRTVNVHGYIGDNWEVELYINNKLIDFTHTDATGEYNFLVDVNYGSSRVLLKMYGPNGEMETREEYYKVPFNLIPKKEIEYTAAAGIKNNRFEENRYAQLNTYYGMFNNLTIGMSSDIPLDSKIGEKPLYAGEMTFKPMGNLLLNGIVSPDNEMTYSINYTNPALATINASYTRFYENEILNKLHHQNNFTLNISSPLKIGGKYFGLRYRMSIDKFPEYKATNMYYSIKVPIFKFHFNYMGSFKLARYTGRDDKNLASQLFISTSFLRWFRPQFKVAYDHSAGQMTSYGVYIQKRIFKRGQLALSFERNNLLGINQVMLTFNIFSGWANFTSRFYSSGENNVFTQMQRGSIRYDQDDKRFRFERRNGVGLGSAVIQPYHDENYNGMMDIGEQLIPELRANIGGTSGNRKRKGELFYYDGLRPYDDYIVRIDPYSLDDPMLQPAHDNFRVAVSPNSVTSIKVPIVTAAEINGRIERIVKGSRTGVGGSRVIITNELSGKEVIITAFNDGEFFHLGLVPGMYRAKLDQKQLDKFGYKAEPEEIRFQVKTVEGGDFIENLNFLITPK
jgi:hypothetical protein